MRCFLWKQKVLMRVIEQLRMDVRVDEYYRQVSSDMKNNIFTSAKSQNIERPVRGSHARVFDRELLQMYSLNPGLKELDENDHIIEASRVMNILYLLYKRQEIITAYWLCPFQLLFCNKSDREENLLMLTILTENMLKYFKPLPKKTFDLASMVIDYLKKHDPKYYSAMEESVKQQVQQPSFDVSVKQDFFPEIVHIDQKKGEKILQKMSLDPNHSYEEKETEPFTNIHIFIRKWIWQGFSGVLSVRSLLYMWDQLMLGSWKDKEIITACLAILLLLRSQLSEMKKTYLGVRKMLVMTPSMLYCKDLSHAYKHLLEGGDWGEMYKRTEPSRDRLQNY